MSVIISNKQSSNIDKTNIGLATIVKAEEQGLSDDAENWRSYIDARNKLKYLIEIVMLLKILRQRFAVVAILKSL